MSAPAPLPDHTRSILDALAGREQTLLALDYDGTLAPIVDDPREAAMPAATAATLARLAESPRYRVAIVSGRSLDDLRGRAPSGVVLIGNHGLEIEGAGLSFVHHAAAAAAGAIDLACDEIERSLPRTPGVFVERKRLSATVHYRRAQPAAVAPVTAAVRAAAAGYSVVVKHAAMALEVRPQVQWNKGLAVCVLFAHLRTSNPGLLSAGDDAADEDMFDLAHHEISIKVGDPGTTRARYYVPDVAQLAAFLQQLP